MRIVSTLVILIICFLIGGGIYYLLNRTGTTSPLGSATDNSLLIQDISIQSTTETGATITWKTDQPASSQVKISDANGSPITETKLQETLDTSHSVVVSGLKPNTTYKLTLVSVDATGKETTSVKELTTTAAVTTDKTAPTISGLNVSNITESSAIITWTTNEPATSQVKYDKSDKISSTTPIDKTLTTNHSVRITKLDSGTSYNCNVISRDAAGNETISATKQTFKTLTPIPIGAQVDYRAPDFVLQDLSGKDVRLGDFRGKIVMINFWATWCGPCKDELPYIQAVSKEWASKGVVVLAIAVNTSNERLDTVRQFISQNSYTFPVLYDSDGKVQNLYGFTPSTTIPRTFFIDAEGIIKKIQVGSFADQNSIENILNSIK